MGIFFPEEWQVEVGVHVASKRVTNSGAVAYICNCCVTARRRRADGARGHQCGRGGSDYSEGCRRSNVFHTNPTLYTNGSTQIHIIHTVLQLYNVCSTQTRMYSMLIEKKSCSGCVWVCQYAHTFLIISRQFICTLNHQIVKRDAVRTRKKSSRRFHNSRCKICPHRH